MLNYEVPEEMLRPFVPSGVELDRYDGRLYVSVVGFRFLDTRVLGFGIPGHRSFEEVNLRFYVRRHVGDDVRRGVVFIRELVPRAAVAVIARLAYNEPYRALPMRHRVDPDGEGRTVREYAWHANASWTRLRAVTRGPSDLLAVGSEEEFVTEHFWGYTRQRDGGTIEYRVEHPRWRIWHAEEAALEGNVAPVYGDAFARTLSGPARSAFVADGSLVTVFAPSRLR